MHPRINMIVFIETLDLNPPKSKIDLLERIALLLKTIAANKEGCTFLNSKTDKRYIDIISQYLMPFNKELKLNFQYNSLNMLYITNITEKTFQPLSNLLQKELFMEKLVKEAESRVSQTYQKIIEDLKTENEQLHLKLLHKKTPIKEHVMAIEPEKKLPVSAPVKMKPATTLATQNRERPIDDYEYDSDEEDEKKPQFRK